MSEGNQSWIHLYGRIIDAIESGKVENKKFNVAGLTVLTTASKSKTGKNNHVRMINY